MSVTTAAEDLLVTQSAVSRQIRSLELSLGVRLFDRRHRAISLTPEGKRLFSVAESAIQDLQRVLETIAVTSRQRPVSITCPNGFATLWLIPRLSALQKIHPGVELRIEASDRIEKLETSGIDLAVRYALGEAEEAGALPLFHETLVVVAHPSIELNEDSSAAEMAKFHLLEFVGHRAPWLSWETWLDACPSRRELPWLMLRFNRYDQVISAALSGQGIAIGRVPLIRDLLDDGRLRCVGHVGAPAASNHAYWLLGPETTARKEVTDVVKWITDEAGVHRDRATATSTEAQF